MRSRFVAVLLSFVLLAGCGGSASRVADADPLQDSVEFLNESIAGALSAVRAEAAPRDPEEENDSERSLPGALAEVVTAARALANAAAGKPMEADAKAILIAAQELEKKAKATISVSELAQPLRELQSKAAALEDKR